MQHNTITELGILRPGDRFRFVKSYEVWQVIKHTRSHTLINLPLGKKMMHKCDAMKKSSTVVTFLRHTIPLPGEQCFVEDLKSGDVFYVKGDAIKEY